MQHRVEQSKQSQTIQEVTTMRVSPRSQQIRLDINEIQRELRHLKNTDRLQQALTLA